MASYQYTPYGEFLSESTTGDHATFGYTGHRLDRELNHYYAKYRYYNPTTMRWLKRDPLGMVDGPNVYAYVRGNVVNISDSLGLSKDCDEPNLPCRRPGESQEQCYDRAVDRQYTRIRNGGCVVICSLLGPKACIACFVATEIHDESIWRRCKRTCEEIENERAERERDIWERSHKIPPWN